MSFGLDTGGGGITSGGATSSLSAPNNFSYGPQGTLTLNQKDKFMPAIVGLGFIAVTLAIWNNKPKKQK